MSKKTEKKSTIVSTLVAAALMGGLFSAAYMTNRVQDVLVSGYINEITEQKLFETGDNIKISINSLGGSVFSLEGIYVTLHKKQVNTEIQFNASSAAAMIFITGKERAMNADSTVLFHGVRVMTPIGAINAKRAAEMLAAVTKKMETATEAEKLGLKLLQAQLSQLLLMLRAADSRLVLQINGLKNLSNKAKEAIIDAIKSGDDVTFNSEEALELEIATKVVK